MDIKLMIEVVTVSVIFLVIFVVQQQYNFKVVYDNVYQGYTIIWEDYDIIKQEYKQKTIKLFRWKKK
jgi:uncharacterized protein YoxC